MSVKYLPAYRSQNQYGELVATLETRYGSTNRIELMSVRVKHRDKQKDESLATMAGFSVVAGFSGRQPLLHYQTYLPILISLLLAYLHNFTVSFRHVPRRRNKAADATLPLNFLGDRRWHPSAYANPASVPSHILQELLLLPQLCTTLPLI